MAVMQKHEWNSLGSISHEPGFYAWYVKSYLAQKDIKDSINAVKDSKRKGDIAAAAFVITQYLEKRLFAPFARDGYFVSLRGSLLPPYEGIVEHKQTLSQSLVDRLIKEPERLESIGSLLEGAVPVFSSPLYIGMAKNLHKRVASHRRLIIKLRDAQDSKNLTNPNTKSCNEDHSFAAAVVQRQLPPSHLVVYTQSLPQDGESAIDLENLLNRINYPILGRN